MRGNLTSYVLAASAVALGTSLSASAEAQSIGSWTLPEPTSTPTNSTVQGPVDGQNPVVRPTRGAEGTPSAPAPTQVPTISPPPPRRTAAPQEQPSSTPTVRPSAEPTQSVARATPDVASTPDASDTPQAETPPAAPETSTPDQPAISPQPTVPPVSSATSEEDGTSIWWWVAPLAALAALGGVLIYLRRRRVDQSNTEVPEVRLEPAPQPKPAPTPAVQPEPTPAQPAPHPVDNAATTKPSGPELMFEAVGLRLSLVYATLQYRLAISSPQGLPSGHLVGDMIGAHASIQPVEQLAPSPDTLFKLASVPALAEHESRTLKGEVQIPLNAIRVLRQGNASFFVPLVRLCLISDTDGAVVRRVYTVGTDNGAGGISPLRLDTGPREHRDLLTREVEAARDYPSQPVDHRIAVG